MQQTPPGTPLPGINPVNHIHGPLSTFQSITSTNAGLPSFQPTPLRPTSAAHHTSHSTVLRIQATSKAAVQDVEWDTATHQILHITQVPLATKVEIYFGWGLDRDSTVSPSKWDDFVREVVAVAFADGSFTMGGEGFYQGASEPCRKIEAVVVGDPRPRVESVASEWLFRAHQAEVFVILTPLHGSAH